MVDVLKDAEKFVSAIQRKLWSYRVERILKVAYQCTKKIIKFPEE